VTARKEMPLTSAVSLLAPASIISRPGTVLAMKTPTPTVKSAKTRTSSGTPTIVASPQDTGCSPTRTTRPSVASATTPKMIAPAASVVITGLSPAATTSPCRMPTSTSATRTTRIASAGAHPFPTRARNTIVPAIADCCVPSEMKFPDSVIGVIATATIPTIDALRRIARTLSTVRKLGVRATATMTPTATAASTSAVETRSARPASRGASGASAATPGEAAVMPPPRRPIDA
jgi:hypothetical protein